jgi:hypothetical protein
MSKTASTERAKLLANWMNAVSVTVLGAGALLPVLSVHFGIGAPMRYPEYVWHLLVICTSASGGLHLLGSLILGRLSDD